MKKESFSFRLRAWFNNLPIQDPVERRMASLLQVILIGLITVILFATIVLMATSSLDTQEKLDALTGNFFGFLVVMLPLSLLRRGYFRSSALIIITILFITPALAIVVFDLANSAGILIQFTLAIILAGLLVSRRMLALVFGLSAALVAFSAFQGQSAEPRLARLSTETAINFILFNGLIALFLDHFGLTLRTALTNALARESELQSDITDRKQALEKIAYQAYLLENVNDAVIGSDANSFIRFWNQGAEKLFGWKAEEVLGRSGREILRSEFLNADRETVLKTLAEHGRWKGEAILYRKDGSQLIMEASSITLRDANGLITGYVSVNRDITERKQAQAALRENEERYRRFFENMHEIFVVQEVIMDEARNPIDLRFVDINPAAERFLGKTRNELVGRTRSELSGQPDPEGVEMASRVASTGTPFHMVRYSPGFGSWFESFTYSLGSGIVATLSLNITERKEAEKALERMNEELEIQVQERTAALSQANNLLQMLLDNMPDQIYFKDAQSRFIRNSRSQAKALGLSDPAEAVGKSDFDFFPHAQASFEKEQEIMRSGKPLVDQEEYVVWPNGQETWVSTTKVPMLDQAGQIIGTFGISRDITERKRGEARLQKAKLELEAANKELEAFSYSVSHDLRSPLRTIDGFSQALLEDYADQLPAEGQDDLKRVRAATQRMGQLIDDLLNLSKVTRAPMKLVPVDLSGLARGIAAELQRTQHERRVKISIAPHLKARGDPSLIQAILENLLNNAWKFTAKREQAEIEFGSKTENDETIYFIRDNGAGFDMAYVGKLFGAFQRLHAMTEFSGTGIGLATVQRIINRHGGRIWAEGAVGQGATFFFTLPPLEHTKPEAVLPEKDSLAKRVREII